MARREAPLTVNQFTGGLNTQFNPLSVPPDVSIDERNMEVTLQGSRTKRLGFNYEENFAEIDSGVPHEPSKNLGRNVFRWENAGNIPEKYILVVQIGEHIAFYDYDDVNGVTQEQIFEETWTDVEYETTASFAVVDGLLVVVNSSKPIYIYEYDGTNITRSTKELLIRDLFGTQAVIGGVDLTQQENLTVRPETTIPQHTYNLRNQTFAHPYKVDNNETLKDPIAGFRESTDVTVEYTFNPDGTVRPTTTEVVAVGRYPSNADNLNLFLYSDPNDGDNRLVERFFATNMKTLAPQVGEAPKGFFIIDALERGQSRRDNDVKLRQQYESLVFSSNTGLPIDRTPGGASVVQEFAGRVWFSGFSGQVIGGDSKSPRMSSYVLFSSLVKDVSNINQCYQVADPTSNKDADLVETDGGFIRLSGAYGISQMVNIANSLFVFGANGVWRITGDSDSNFTATSYQVEKVTNFGILGSNSVVVSNNDIFYWSEEGIMVIRRNEFGVWAALNISEKTIQDVYSVIPEEIKRSVSGFQDIYQKKIRWVYCSSRGPADYSEELIFDLTYGMFTYNRIPSKENGLPLVMDIVRSQPYKSINSTESVTVLGEQVTASTIPVTVGVDVRNDSLKESFYLVITQFAPTIRYTLGYYRDRNFYDWTDVGYEAYITTGMFTGGEPRLKKQIPYLYVYLEKTENGFDVNLQPTNASSCMVSSRWDWTDSFKAFKWSPPRETYRLPRIYMPVDTDDPYDTGRTVIETRSKIRGSGKSVAFKFNSQPGKNMHIHGWAFTLQANRDE